MTVLGDPANRIYIAVVQSSRYKSMDERRCRFSVEFRFLQRVHSLPREAWIFAQCTQKCVSVVRVFLWGRFAQGVKSSPFYPQTFFNGPNKANILHRRE